LNKSNVKESTSFLSSFGADFFSYSVSFDFFVGGSSGPSSSEDS